MPNTTRILERQNMLHAFTPTGVNIESKTPEVNDNKLRTGLIPSHKWMAWDVCCMFFRFLCSLKDPFEKYYYRCGFPEESLPSAGRTLSVCFWKWCHTPTVPEEQSGSLPQCHWMVRFAGLMWLRSFEAVDSDWLLISVPAPPLAPRFLLDPLLKCHRMKRSSRRLFCWPVPAMSSHPLFPPSASLMYWKLYRCGPSLWCDDSNCWFLVPETDRSW